MIDDEKTKKQLIDELVELRAQNATLKESATGSISADLVVEEARRYAESIVETIREPLLVLDADLKIVSANRNFYRTFNVTPGETLGCFIYELGNKQWDIPQLQELLEEILPEKEVFDDFEVAHTFQDIGHKVMLLNARQIYRKTIGTKMILLAIEDITEHKRLEDILAESEERYRRLFETASDGIVLLEKREGKITHANPATEEILGYTKEESIGNKLQDIGVFIDMVDFQTTMQDLNTSGILNYYDVPVTTKSGQHIDTDIYLVDRARLVQCNIRDVSQRKLAEKELQESEERYRAVVEDQTEIISRFREDGTFTFVNDVFCRFFGKQAGDLIGKKWQPVVVPENLPHIYEKLRMLSPSNPVVMIENRVYSGDGHVHWFQFVNRGSFDQQGRLTEIQSVGRDITERKQAEEALRISEGRYRMAEAVGHVGNWEYNLQTTKFWGSDEANRIYGFDPEALDFSTDEVENCIPERERVHQALIDLIEADKPYNLEFEIHPKNSLKPRIISSVAELKRDEHGNPLLVTGLIQDITERKRVEEEIRLDEARMKSLLKISQHKAESIRELLDFALDEAIRLTGSKMGYIYFYDDQKKEFTLNTWSKEVMKECTITEPQTIYHLEKTGIWGEAVRQAKPVMVNDFQAPHPLKKGYPEGHAALYKYLTIPVFNADRIAAVV
ncbi:MAG: PAS domain S-box protein, partial [Syntrophales bacterium]|nr:PAS domain S-box protein [Syntrophales bacterium]